MAFEGTEESAVGLWVGFAGAIVGESIGVAVAGFKLNTIKCYRIRHQSS